MRERLQKILARAGVASRRAAEELITAGRVRVNGKVVSELGAQAHPFQDKVEVDGRQVLAENAQYVVLHKPREVVSTLSDPEGRPTVADFLKDAGGRMYPVGRLDFATSGVLLATNDGEFANGLLHPRKAVPKTYVVKVRGRMGDEDLDRWRNGVMLEDGKTLPADVRRMRYEEERTWLEVTIREGRNQQIRRMGDATGFFVMRLARISFAGITSDDLRPGQWRYLTRDELTDLREAYGVPKRVKQVEVPLKPSDRSSKARGRVVQRGDEPTPRRLRGAAAEAASERAAEGRAPARERRGGAAREGRPVAPREERGGPREGRPVAPRDGRGGPREGRPVAPREGRGAPPREGRPVAPREGRGGPREGRPVAPREGRPVAPREGRPVAPRGGRGGPREGRPVAPREGRPVAPREGRGAGGRPAAPRDERARDSARTSDAPPRGPRKGPRSSGGTSPPAGAPRRPRKV
jgi:23S rRNA pseudouridine2605 synthase